MIHLEIGPHNSPVIGPMKFRLQTDGECILRADVLAGYTHRGIEKIAERMTWIGYVPFTDRIDYVSSIHSNLAYVMAVEKLAKIEVPERAQQIRVTVCELSRISSHLLNLALTARSLGAGTVAQYALRDREKINDLFEMLTGARLTHTYLRIGGVCLDISAGFIERALEFSDYLKAKMLELDPLFFGNRIVSNRLKSLGRLSSVDALSMGLSGPNLRATGLSLDLRKSKPYLGYDKLQFETAVGVGRSNGYGSAEDRLRVRLQEISESLHILKQALVKIPSGSHVAQLPRVFKAPKGEAQMYVEGPRGIIGAYVRSEGDKMPSRVHFRTPSLMSIAALEKAAKETALGDFDPLVHSFDILASEVDR